jgi:hypothetical protein
VLTILRNRAYLGQILADAGSWAFKRCVRGVDLLQAWPCYPGRYREPQALDKRNSLMCRVTM